MLQAAVHFICLINRLTATKVDYFGQINQQSTTYIAARVRTHDHRIGIAKRDTSML